MYVTERNHQLLLFMMIVTENTYCNHTIVQILGPNLDPRFPDCLESRPDEARRLLRLSYDKALACFWDMASAAIACRKTPEVFRGTIPGTGRENSARDQMESNDAPSLGGVKRPADSPVGGENTRRSRYRLLFCFTLPDRVEYVSV